MSEQEVYFQEQEFKRFETIMNTQEYLTKEEYDFCFAWDEDQVRTDITYLGVIDGAKAYLNLGVYSEHDHEKRGEDDVNNDDQWCSYSGMPSPNSYSEVNEYNEMGRS